MLQKILPFLGLAAWGQSSEPAFNGSCGAVWGGADLVEYWSLEPSASGVFGTVQHSRTYGGYTFFFKDVVNADLFMATPNEYLPGWGGFDAWSLANENHYRPGLMGPPCNPTTSWFTWNGTLYCALSPYFRNTFLKRVNHSIVVGDDKWIGYYGRLNAGPINNGCYQTNIAQCEAGNVSFHDRNNTWH